MFKIYGHIVKGSIFFLTDFGNYIHSFQNAVSDVLRYCSFCKSVHFCWQISAVTFIVFKILLAMSCDTAVFVKGSIFLTDFGNYIHSFQNSVSDVLRYCSFCKRVHFFWQISAVTFIVFKILLAMSCDTAVFVAVLELLRNRASCLISSSSS